MGDKYKLTNITKKLGGYTFYRIQALKTFKGVKKGDFGGYIQDYHNLSQKGNCWVYDESVVGDKALVCENARVFNKASIVGNSFVGGSAVIKDDVEINDNVKVKDNAIVQGHVLIKGYPIIRGNAIVSSQKDFIVFKNNWSSMRYFTYTCSDKMWSVGCFHGSGKELIKKAYKDNKLNGDMYSLYVKLVKNMEEVKNGG